MNDRGVRRDPSGEQGFTLIEALVAMVILLFGVAAVANLMVVAGSSNSAANHSTAAATAATQTMELLKSTPSNLLVPGGVIDGTITPTADQCGVTPITASYSCNTASRLTAPDGKDDFAGVGTIHVRWQIGPAVAAGSLTTQFIAVSAESLSPAMGRRSRVVLTTFRTNNP